MVFPFMNRRQWIRALIAGAAVSAVRMAMGPARAEASPVGGRFRLPPLPYADNALEPHLSSRTLGFHHGKHHRGYVDKLNALVRGTAFEDASLGSVIRGTAGRPDKAALFNSAAQAWNHAFYWRCMRPQGGGEPGGRLGSALERTFGGLRAFKEAFASAAASQFGSGWAWLVLDGDALKVVKTANADTPLVRGQIPLLTIDVWEHAYYLDYQNRRKDYIAAFLKHLLNWEFVETNFSRAFQKTNR